jgi:hypothetical protein
MSLRGCLLLSPSRCLPNCLAFLHHCLRHHHAHAHPSVLQLTKDMLQPSSARYTLLQFLVLIWSLCVPEVQELAFRDEPVSVRDVILRAVKGQLLFSLHGLRPNGELFEKDGRHLQIFRPIEFVVMHLQSVFMHL